MWFWVTSLGSDICSNEQEKKLQTKIKASTGFLGNEITSFTFTKKDHINDGIVVNEFIYIYIYIFIRMCEKEKDSLEYQVDIFC